MTDHAWRNNADRRRLRENGSCEDLVLDEHAVGYVRGSLQNGGTLAHELVQEKDLAAGLVRTLLPRDLPRKGLDDFTSGIFPEPSAEEQYHSTDEKGSSWRLMPVPNTDECIVSVVQCFLEGDGRRICVLENALMAPADVTMHPHVLPVIVFGDEVYQVLRPGSGNREAILRTVNNARSWLPNGALTMAPPGVNLSRDVTLFRREHLRYLATRTTHIVVGAYDGEGLLIWSET